jgi:DNA-binding NarL/FixJ family response regulator
MIRVAIVEDHPEISAGLNYIISSTKGFSCKVFRTAEAAMNNISPSEFDIVLMDIQLPGMSGIEATQLLKQKYPEIKIMMCTVFEDDEKIYRAIAAGASGYILKRSEPYTLIQSLNELMEGGAPISSAVAQKVLSAFRQMMPQSMTESPLSEREQEVLSLIAAGLRNKEVADKLSVSIATVKSHIYNIYQKLHVNSRVEAINKFKSQPKG